MMSIQTCNKLIFASRRCYSSITFESEHKGSKSPQNYWNDIANQRKFVDWAARQLNLQDLNSWYGVTQKDLKDIGGGGLLMKYNGSPLRLLSAVYPEHEWLPWKFSKCPPNYWESLDNQKKYMDWLARQLKLKETADWYKVSLLDHKNFGGSGLLIKYNDSLSQLLNAVYPNYDWLPWKFERVPGNYWEDINNQKKFMDWVFKELKLSDMNSCLQEVGGGYLLKKYNDSPSTLLSSVYSDYAWLPWKFEKCPSNYWEDIENQRFFMNWIYKEYKMVDLNDWYKVSIMDIKNLGGVGLANKYNNSLSELLNSIYPNYSWIDWKFLNRNNINKDYRGVLNFVEWAGKRLGIKELKDWYNVSSKDIADLGGYFEHNSLSQLLSIAYPDYPWDFKPNKSNSHHKKSQYLLKMCIKTLFPKEDLLEEYKHPDIVYSTGHPLELDYFYPQLNIAFEYQGHQHYKNVLGFHRYSDSLEETQLRDKHKSDLCKEKVPYWWDRECSSVAATVYNQLPHLFVKPPGGHPIPSSPPEKQQRVKKENVTKNVLMTATLWENSTMDPTGWWMSEKYDGMRLFWNGSQFYTRQGNQVRAPGYVTSKLPNVALDGELWTQYGLHQEAVNLCKTTDEEKWRKAVFWVFDAPDISRRPFEERLEYLYELHKKGLLPSFVKIVNMIKCKDANHLKSFFNEIVTKGGEGIMLREPQSLYTAGRSDALRKYKSYFDSEVKVIENNYPYGFNCLQMNGLNIFVKLNDNSKEAKDIKIGSVITVKHSGVNVYGNLQFPQFYRERTDISWNDVIKSI